MTFDALLTRVYDLLQRQGRLSYRALKARFRLDDDLLEALKDELIYAQRVAADEDDRVVVWMGERASPSAAGPGPAGTQARAPLSYTPAHLAEKILLSRHTLEPEGAHHVESTHRVERRRADHSRPDPQRAEIFCVSA